MKMAVRVLAIILVASLIAAFSVIFSYSINQPPNINTPLTMPDLYVYDDGQFVNYKIAQSAYYQDGRAEIIISTGKFISGATLTYRAVDYNYTYIMGTTQSVEGYFECYDLYTGALVNSGSCYLWAGSGNDYRIAINGTMSGFPAGYNIAQYCYLPDGIIRSGYKYNQVEPFITFSVIPPEPKLYQSYMSEPVSDPLNKYVILAGDDGSYLFWINIRCRDFEELVYSWDLSTYAVYTEIVKAQSLFTPTLKFNANGQSILSIECNQQLLDWYKMFNTNQGIYDWKISFDCLITKYDLLTGEYIDNSYHSNCVLQSQYIDINASNYFGSASDYDSIMVYGLNYYNQSDYLLNRLACLWGVDPSFIEWRENMYNKIDQIYNILKGDETQFQTDPAVASEVSNYNNLESQLIQDKSADLSSALGAGSGAMSNNNALAWIKNTIENTIFSNSKLTTYIIFALGMGLVVLTLGRKIKV